MGGQGDRIAVGRVVKPHGIRGAVKVQLLTDFPERFQTLTRVYLEEGAEALLIEGDVAFDPKGRALIQFEHVRSREAAEALRGAYLFIPASELVTLPADSFYVQELVGCQVESDGGHVIGAVTAVIRTGSNEVLVVSGAGATEELIPFVRDVIQVCDPAAGRIVIRLLPGLLTES